MSLGDSSIKELESDVQQSMKVVYIREEVEELLTRKELCERILRCDENTADKYYLNKPGFPYINQGKRRRYPKKLVENWINKNTHYN